jgi:hypothetical protein
MNQDNSTQNHNNPNQPGGPFGGFTRNTQADEFQGKRLDPREENLGTEPKSNDQGDPLLDVPILPSHPTQNPPTSHGKILKILIATGDLSPNPEPRGSDLIL